MDPSDGYYKPVSSEGLKKALVIPLPLKKIHDTSNPADDYSVLNLLFLGKVTEGAVAEQLQGFLDIVSVLAPFQSTFCTGRNIGGSALLSLLNLTAVFDTIDDDLLACRLADVGIWGTI